MSVQYESFEGHSIAWDHIVNRHAYDQDKIDNMTPQQLTLRILRSQPKNENRIIGVIVKQTARIASLYYTYFRLNPSDSSLKTIHKHVRLIDRLPRQLALFQNNDLLYSNPYELMVQYAHKGMMENEDFFLEDWIQCKIPYLSQTNGDIHIISASSSLTNIPIVHNIFQSTLKTLTPFSYSSFLGLIERCMLLNSRKAPASLPIVLAKSLLQNTYNNVTRETETICRIYKKVGELDLFESGFRICSLEYHPTSMNTWSFVSIESQQHTHSPFSWNQEMLPPKIIEKTMGCFKETQENIPHLFNKYKFLNSTDFFSSDFLDESPKRICNELWLTNKGRLLSLYRLVMGQAYFMDLHSKNDITTLRFEKKYLDSILAEQPDRFSSHYLWQTILQIDASLPENILSPLFDMILAYYGYYGHLPICPTLTEQ